MRVWIVHSAVLAFFLLLVLLLTYPLVNYLTTAVPGPPGDNFDFLWRQAWFARALFDDHLSPFHTDKLYYPFGYDLALGPMSLAQVFLSLPFTMAGGHVLSYNILCLLSFVLAGFGAHLLVLWLTGSSIAGMAAGTVFAFCPARIMTLTAGCFNVLGTMWLPYAALCLELMLHAPRMRWGIAAGVFCTFIIFSDWYNVPMLGLVLIVYFLYRARPWKSHLGQPRFRMALSAFLAILLLSALVSLFLTRPLWQGTAQEPAYSLPYVDSLAPSLDYFFIPYALRTVLGQPPISYAVSLVSLPVYIGVSTLVLAALGFATRRDRIVRGFVWIALVALLLALGPRLRWDGEPVLIPVPAQVERLFTAGMRILSTQLASTPMPSYYALRVPSRIYIPLPALALQLFVPFLSKMRLWSRFALVLCLPLAVLAGMGVSYLLSHVRCVLKAHSLANTRPEDMMERVLGVGLVCAVFLESAILPYHMGYSEARPQAVDLWLADQEDDFAIAEFPYEKQLSGAYLFYRTVFHGKSLCSGSQPFAPEGHRAARALLYAFPSVGTTELLKTWGPKYVLVGSREYGNQWDQVQREIAAQPDLRLVTVFDDVPIYHDASLCNLIPGYGRRLMADRVYVYELDSEEGAH